MREPIYIYIVRLMYSHVETQQFCIDSGGKPTDTPFTISKSLESKSKSQKLRTYRQDPGLVVAVIDLRSSIIALGAVLV